tara:strand:+ start:40 stop:267 length:228 start_codon:yes stop_codon:yes gene_type:complete
MKTIKKKKILSGKTNRNSQNVSTLQGDSKPQTDTSKDIHVGAQLGYPQESVKKLDSFKKKITFKEFMKKSHAMNF